MTLLITTFAALIVTILWYGSEKRQMYRLSLLARIYWGAALMWFVDALVEYSELKAAYFTPSAADMQNDAFLGLSVVALGLLLWIAALFKSDPKGLLKKGMYKN